MPAAPEREQAMKLTYAVVFEQTPNNHCAYVPDVPGCISTGKTWDEMQAMIREAIARHNEPIPEDVLRSYAECGDDTPTLSTRVELVEVEVPAPHAARAS